MKMLLTQRLRLRPRTLDDLEAIVAMDTDPEVRRFIGKMPEADAHRANVMKSIVEGRAAPYHSWAINWMERPGFLGQCVLSPHHELTATELGWRLQRTSWGQGIASEAAGAILRHAADELSLAPLVALIHPDNRASRRVAEKIGLTLSGETVFARGSMQLVYRL